MAPTSIRDDPVNRHRPNPLLGALLVSGCSIVSLPPSSSRTDGGPVASRGVVSHEAKSQLRIYRDAAGCESLQTVNRQFRLVAVHGATPDGASRRLVLEESYDVRHCLTAESSSSEAVVTAWRPDTASAEPVFRLFGRGVRGEPSGNLYLMVASGCCGSQNLTTYFSLLTGETLLSSSLPVRQLTNPASRNVRIVGLHDTFSAGAPPETAADSTVVGVLTWASESKTLQRILVATDRPEAFALASIGFTRAGRPLPDTSLTVWDKDSAAVFGVEAKLVAPGSGRTISVRIPIEKLLLVPSRAQISPGVRVRPVR